MSLRQLSMLERGQAILGLALTADTLVLLAYRKINAGTILPGCIGLALLALLWAKPLIQAWQTRRWFAWMWHGAKILCGVWLLSFLGFVLVFATLRPEPDAHAPDCMIVLGAGLRGNEPSPLLYNRLNLALALAQRYPKIPVIVSGGRGQNEEATEAEAMRRFLLQAGLAPERILLEDRATNTAENLTFSRELLLARGLAPASLQLAIVTSDFHAIRAARLASHVGLPHHAVFSAPTPLSIVFNVWLREYFSCIKAWYLGEL